jgi:fumarate reductase flavoprotein subunit
LHSIQFADKIILVVLNVGGKQMKKIISALLLGVMLTACSPADATEGGADSQTKEVTVTGMAEGLKVKVTATEDKIEKVEVVEHNETPDISDPAIANMPGKIVDANKVNVDVETGASMTSEGIKKAVEQALEEMGYDVAKFK